MLISHQKKFIYFKTKKTAGTSIEIYFERYCRPIVESSSQILPQMTHKTDTLQEFPEGIIGIRGENPDVRSLWNEHMPARDLKENVSDEIWNTYFKFTAVRNPYEVAVSSFFWFNLYYNKSETRKQISTLSLEDLKMRFEDFIDEHYDPNSDIYSIDGKPCVDAFIRYENLHQDTQDICKRIGSIWKPKFFKRYKSNVRNNDMTIDMFYNENAKQIIKERSNFEIDNFGYQFPE